MNEMFQALALLKSLKNNLSGSSNNVEEKYIKEYNDNVLIIEKSINQNLQKYLVPQEDIRPIVISFNMLSGAKTYSRNSFCDKKFILMKLDALLNYIDTLLSLNGREEESKIGF